MDPSLARQRAASLAWATARSWNEGRLVEARWACEEALALQVQAGSPTGAASVATTLGRVLHTLGAPAEARRHLEAALERHLADGDARLAALTRQELAAVELLEGRPAVAVDLLVEALRSHDERGEVAFDARARLRLGEACHAAGRLEEALTHLDAVRAAGEGVRDAALRAGCAAAAGHLLHESGAPSDALRSYGLGLAVCDGAPPWHEVDLRIGVARLRAERGLTDAAWLEATAAAELASTVGVRLQLGVAQATLGVVAALDGRVAEAGDALDQAAEVLAPIGPWSGLVEVGRGHLDLARGDREAALLRMGAVTDAALELVAVRLALRGLRTAVSGR